MTRHDVVGDAFGSFTRISRTSVFLVIALSAISAAYDLWRLHSEMGWRDVAFLCLFVPASLIVIYRLARDMSRALPPSFGAFGRFWAGYLVSVMPMITAFAIPMTVPRETGWAIWAFLILLVVGLATVVLLQAWPVSLAATNMWISPLRVVRATRGHRWKLTVCFFVLGIGNRLPSPDESRSPIENVGCALLEFGGTAFQILLIAGIAVAAWRAASANDTGLRGSPYLD